MKRSASEISSPEQQISSSNEEEQANKKRHLSPLSPSLSTLDALPLHTIFTFLNNDLSSQLALYGTCSNVMTFVRNEKLVPLHCVLQLKKFTHENPNISLITLHYRMCGLLHQYVWLHDYDLIDYSKLPQHLLGYCKNGLIQVVYSYHDEFYGGGFTYTEVAVKKVNSGEKIRLILTELETIHGRGFEEVGSVDVSIDNTRVYNGSSITDLETLNEFTQNAEICKEMNGIELLNSLFRLSMNEKEIHKEDSWYDSFSFSPTRFERVHESIIDKFISEVVDVNNEHSFQSIHALVSITENLCSVKCKKEDKEEAIDDDEQTTEKEEEELDLFEFVSLVKHNINHLYYDEYSSYSRQYIDCILKRKDNGEIVPFSVTSIVGPSYTGTYVELEMMINGEVALTFEMTEGSVDSNIVQDSFETFVESFKTSKNPHEFASDMLDFIVTQPKWAVYSLYEMDKDKTGITIEDGYPPENISEVLDHFCEHTDE
ncbi:predicted protein [Naegleria gruberi]|uniref:Predicted protein n=1 Tax=Naegleria gruberi TaxID=5762 RepID=D2VJC1_NAEGR|nr:uncharacterized protein NAEGRDRAFT_50019 [Naegleria gruberi]EFC43012.1 predicted protein [Naegleria gruberi]|eukprot:XP_002675756.1 predicted protein [Naegleria gruberi strain NEG-M]